MNGGVKGSTPFCRGSMTCIWCLLDASLRLAQKNLPLGSFYPALRAGNLLTARFEACAVWAQGICTTDALKGEQSSDPHGSLDAYFLSLLFPVMVQDQIRPFCSLLPVTTLLCYQVYAAYRGGRSGCDGGCPTCFWPLKNPFTYSTLILTL